MEPIRGKHVRPRTRSSGVTSRAVPASVRAARARCARAAAGVPASTGVRHSPPHARGAVRRRPERHVRAHAPELHRRVDAAADLVDDPRVRPCAPSMHCAL